MRKVEWILVVGLALLAMGGNPAMGASSRGNGSALARITFYCSDRGSGGPIASTGVRLEPGKHVAVDPAIIPYGSQVTIPGLGTYRAVDSGSGVRARTAARRAAGGNPRKANAIVVDVFVAGPDTVRRMAATFPMYTDVTWSTKPTKSSAHATARTSATQLDAVAKNIENSPSKETAQDRPERKVLMALSSKG
ncbi:MAG TPA: 3D domain-containing protein [Verrucomicrobiae bacterium]|nr:3D domain-containing protein [Verrucomicrobiae bacterium]